MCVSTSVSRGYLRQILVEGLLGAEAEVDGDFARAQEEGLDELRRLLGAGDGEALEMTSEGEERDFVFSVLRTWLARSPWGTLRLGEPAAGKAVGALVFGWSATVIHALAQAPLTLMELKRAIDALSTEILIERVGDLRANGLVDVKVGADGRKRYAATEWLRAGIAPLAAAGRLERHFPAVDTVPPDALDVGAAFFLTMPMVELPYELAGTCRLGVEVEKGGRLQVAGVTARVAGGRVVGCEPGFGEGADAFAIGSTMDWFDTLVQPETSRVRTGGMEGLAPTLLDSLHETLFGAVAR